MIIDNLNKLSKLEALSLNNVSEVDIKKLCLMSNLKTITISEARLQNFKYISCFKRLEYLSLDYLFISDLVWDELLLDLKSLKQLSMCDMDISFFSSLKPLDNLEVLALEFCKIGELPLLGKNLTHLFVEGSIISNMNSLLDHKSLKYVNHYRATIPKDHLDDLKLQLPHVEFSDYSGALCSLLWDQRSRD